MIFASIFACFDTQYKALDGSCQYYGNIIGDQMCGYNARFINNQCECKSDYPYTDPIFAGCTACTETDEDQIGMFSGQCQCHNNFAWDSTLTKPTCVADCGGKPFYVTDKNVKICVSKCSTSNCSCESSFLLYNGICQNCNKLISVNNQCICENYYLANQQCLTQQECQNYFSNQICMCQGFIYDTTLDVNKCIIMNQCKMILSIDLLQCISAETCIKYKGAVNGSLCMCQSSSGYCYDKRSSKIANKCIQISECRNLTLSNYCYSFNITGICEIGLHMNANKTACIQSCPSPSEILDNSSYPQNCICAGGYYMNNNSCTKTICYPSYVDLSGNNCVSSCPKYQQMNNQRCICASGYFKESFEINKIDCFKESVSCPGQLQSPYTKLCQSSCKSDETITDDHSGCKCLNYYDKNKKKCVNECEYYLDNSSLKICGQLGTQQCPFYYSYASKLYCTLNCSQFIVNKQCVDNPVQPVEPENKGNNILVIVIPIVVVPIVIAIIVVTVLLVKGRKQQNKKYQNIEIKQAQEFDLGLM
ncbi:Hypothetical_protein [Hexamita inflata]|uniref:Hypothetical_protein n=1 Tax=Hexamita inflata TaxID=28002 RepID=A0AA86QS63_9EUKA|nr:Hypothetical protein HINF_LOCUS44680 [Hexamita inflata]